MVAAVSIGYARYKDVKDQQEEYINKGIFKKWELVSIITKVYNSWLVHEFQHMVSKEARKLIYDCCNNSYLSDEYYYKQ